MKKALKSYVSSVYSHSTLLYLILGSSNFKPNSLFNESWQQNFTLRRSLVVKLGRK